MNAPQFSMLVPLQWQSASWDDYLRYRDDSTERLRLYFNGRAVLADMGSEGIDHASVSDLFLLLIYIWVKQVQPDLAVGSFGRCVLEKPGQKAASPDLVLYLGAGIPRRDAAKLRRIDLNQWRLPDLVGEIADTTLASDLDEKKRLYAALGIPEYWVIDVRGRVMAFRLADGQYCQCVESVALMGLSIDLLEQALARLGEMPNFAVANWFEQMLA
ncbi:MAG: Uma2 family endonuclease [Pegethrix bostrychoides GSE-TBD4-15B]|jgi:Uma2 family endonuclease|uniref:Uma2 family endonuclease n=1 Tax=Pegethrix bostrychoides GSE-TBD4-15B TaxID=2839662 RepID=A0A951U6Q9_9CYAN|nr:Uma2 family endonuclease [Pegethrix bostrychoides GSE-TBD4-15B]